MPGTKPKSGLHLHEEILLLALKDDEGTVESQVTRSYAYAMGGGILAELLLAGRIGIGPDEKATVNAVDIAPLGEAVLDDCLSKVYAAKGKKTLGNWVVKIGQSKKLTDRVAEGLCNRGILNVEEGKALLVLRRKKYPERNPGPERHMIDRLSEAIFSDGERVGTKTAILVALAHGAGLLEIPFPNEDLETRRERIERIIAGALTADAPQPEADAIRMAGLVASMVPALVVLAADLP